MDTREFAQLIRDSHDNTRSMQKTADAFNKVFRADKSKGWYFKIAYRNYDPASQADRDLFGLDPRPCPRCGHKPAPRHQVRELRIADMPTAQLRAALENREDMPLPDPRMIDALQRAGLLERA